MTHNPLADAPKARPKTLAQQGSDFTAEGAPPLSQVPPLPPDATSVGMLPAPPTPAAKG